ncbi:MAG: histone deacetylase family protein [Candidatus Thorarchaeota archaeon]
MADQTIAIISHPKMDQHTQPFPRPHLESFETPLRRQMVELYLETAGLMDRVAKVKAPKAKIEDVLLVHSPYLMETVELMSELGSGNLGESAYASPELFRAALLATGGAIRAAEMVVQGKAKHAFALVRPPGHHATTSNPSGLCYFNNIAIAVKNIMKYQNVGRISIVDIDNHFGNGTSEIFYSDPNVQFISIHEYDYENFGTGHYEEVGFGEGKGTNVNIPLVDMSPDESYIEAIQQIVVPAVERFRPDLIAVSAGFDAHYADPVGNMDIDSSTFWHVGKTVNNLVDSLELKGSFLVLEGGYNPLAIGPSVAGILFGLMGEGCPVLDDQVAREVRDHITDANRDVIARVLETISSLW